MTIKPKYKTKQRETILAYLETVPGVHITAGDVCEYFRQQGQPIGQATVYRQLESLGRFYHFTLDDPLADLSDEALNVISQTQNRVEVVVVEVDTEKEIGELSLKYLKTRENFERIPVLAVTNNEQANTVAKKQRADEVLAFDTPPAVYKKTIDKLIGR